MPIAHGIFDPHFALPINYSSGGSDYAVLLSYSGISNWLYTLGFTSVFHIYELSIACSLLAVILLLLAKVHSLYLEELLQWLGLNNCGCIYLGGASGVGLLRALPTTDTKVYPIFIWPFRLFVACFDLAGLRLNFHIGALIGFFSMAWSGHLIHVAIPVSRGMGVSYTPHLSLHDIFSSKWVALSNDVDKDNHIFSTSVGAGRAILTFLGGLKSGTASLYLTDIAHHHLAIAVLFIWSCHLYSGLYKGLGHKIRHLLFVNGNSGLSMRSIGKSYALSLSLALAALSVVTSQSAQHIYSLTPYSYLSYDFVTTATLYVHHSWIASFLMVAAFAHAGIFLVRDYTVIARPRHDVIYRILAHKAAILSHLSWVCLWLGFHTLQVYIHNDSQLAFGEPEKQILIEPVFAQVVQACAGKALYGTQIFTVVNPSSGWVVSANNKSFGSLLLPVGPGDFLAHHAIALGLHLTTLILLKGSLDARSSSLMPDKIHFGYGFACDGPGRGGTCDISAWDSFYLAMFWMLNTNAWVIFYFHWRHLTLSQNIVSQFSESSTTLNGWFRDYLWFNSAPLIRAYSALGANDLSVWAWLFLAAHLCWATGFMFLISWRGYWQELIDIILYMHLKTPILYDLFSGGVYTPVALSIVQARFIGLIHFSVGFIFTYAAFVIGATS
jgi:photosystem I P700 chlorophyll a apoprotein A2